ncbi:MAG TPA: DUF2914 domain-containing protein [Gammaproteobacteria bacterium]|nr:DUF2914 domain-containing protein [Gammaproteobacteria bacterium]
MSGAPQLSRGWKTRGWKKRYSLWLLVSLLHYHSAAWAVDDAMPSNPTQETTATSAGPTTTGRVARAMFTTAIVDREPVDAIQTLTTDTSRVFFFSDLRGLAGQIVTHRWIYNDQDMAEVTFKVGDGARWRVYSSKNLLPDWTGTWTVVVSDETGQVLNSSHFEYLPAAPASN